MARFGRFAFRARWAVLAVGSVLVGLCAWWGPGAFSAVGSGGYGAAETEADRAIAAIEAEFGREGFSDVTVLYTSSDAMTVDEPAYRDAVLDAVAAVEGPEVADVVTYWSAAADVAEQYVSFDRTQTQVDIRLAGQTTDDRLESFLAIQPRLDAEGLTAQPGGPVAAIDQLNTAATHDLTTAELIAMPILLVLLIVLLGGVVAGMMPLLVGVTAILGALAALRGIASVTDVSIFAINIATLLGLGLAIDYGVFVVTRFREELARGLPVGDAVANTVASAGRTVLFSGLIVTVAFAGTLLFPTAAYRSFGWGGIAVVLIDVAAAIILLPAVLGVLGHRVDALRMPWARRARSAPSRPRTEGRWARFARLVMRRPVAWFTAAVAVLLMVGSPVLGLQGGVVNHRYLPAGSDDLALVAAADDFPTPTTWGIDGILTGTIAESDAEAYVEAAGALPGATFAEFVQASDTAVHVRAGYAGEPDATASLELIEQLRALPPPSGADQVLYGGPPAAAVDGEAALLQVMPLALGLVAVLSFAILFLALGSLVLPLKAILTAALSLTASTGAIVWGIQNGGLADLLGFAPPGTTDLGNLLLVLLIVFGLAADYELFLLSRIREEYVTSGDNTHAVAIGVQATGRIITSAALLFIVVSATMGITATGLVLTGIGIGMTVAVLVDATLVRLVLVPATMRLLGDRNWWLPGPLRRLHDRIGLAEQSPSHPQEVPDVPVSARL